MTPPWLGSCALCTFQTRCSYTGKRQPTFRSRSDERGAENDCCFCLDVDLTNTRDSPRYDSVSDWHTRNSWRLVANRGV
jgi:hypothetical protein